MFIYFQLYSLFKVKYLNCYFEDDKLQNGTGIIQMFINMENDRDPTHLATKPLSTFCTCCLHNNKI